MSTLTRELKRKLTATVPIGVWYALVCLGVILSLMVLAATGSHP